MLKTYRAAFDAPGAAAFCAAGFIMRVSIAIYPIAFVLLISLRSGHYGFAGVLSGIYVFSGGVGTPVLARLVDRYGQTRVLMPATSAHLLGVIAVVALAEAHAADWTLIAPAIVAGFAYISVGSLIRARWSTALAGREELTAAYSLESTLDEVVFTAGPLLATLVATQVDPVAGFIVGGLAVAGGAVWLRRQRATDPGPHPRGSHRTPSALRFAGMPMVTLAAVAMGAVFASAEVTMIAFCGQHGATSLAGIPVACFALGSGVAGFVYGSRHRRGAVLARFRRQAIVFGALPFLFLAAVDVPMLSVLAFVVGMATAPTLINAFGLVENIVPIAARTEGMSWVITGLSLGYGIAAAVVGRLADAHGARSAFTVTIVSGLLVAALAVGLHARLTGSAESEPLAVA